MIQIRHGDIVEQPVDALVNPINCRGLPEPGAIRFREAFPENFVSYRRACRLRKITVGDVFVVPLAPEGSRPRYILNFPVKRTGRRPARLETVEKGLPALVRACRDLKLRSVAIPPLGVEPGGVDWESVKEKIMEAFEGIGLRVILVPPANRE
ncbi:O-acetyl-ADP-ribose deacetylase (regulator of RNase III) [Melghirimyces profundicolus]|uniref:O-acetyl-ADP-ribose deacetylase (Regulator of RNase III) n=1 Tax=Melghirimyces profundicolus TaxID=1242148 RepID=A0A2T6AXF6_9BACL|nr:macro domain-containing protein [Melghirimyces profundicolus]PTX48492.1 O-acetyl-ADP-ribose deacetylase (regulator of RNase III) [Melghirimyces profundicolus]